MITLVTTYYNEPHHLRKMIKDMNQLYFEELIIVDDGSEDYPAYDIASQYPGVPLKLYRIKEDKGFNSHGARNLAMKHVETEWALLTDIDRTSFNNLSIILTRYIDSSSGGEYFNWATNKGQDTVNDYCIKVEDFWISGGYDEEFSGRHYGDRMFIDRLDRYLTKTTIPYPVKVTRDARKYISAEVDITMYPDDETMVLPHWDLEEKQKIIDTVGFRTDHPDLWQRDNIIQFDWERLI